MKYAKVQKLNIKISRQLSLIKNIHNATIKLLKDISLDIRITAL